MGFVFFPSWLCCPLRFQNSPQTRRWERFLGIWKLLLFYTPFPGWVSIPNSFVSLFVFYTLSYLLSKTMGCLSGCLVSSASVQELFCGICSVFKWSFNEFVGEKVISPSYSSTILGLLPPTDYLLCCQNGETLYSQQKQHRELTVAQIMNSLLPNSDLNLRN